MIKMTVNEYFRARLKTIHSYIGLLQNEIDAYLRKMGKVKPKDEKLANEEVKKYLLAFFEHLKKEKKQYSSILKEHNKTLQEQKIAKIKSRFDLPTEFPLEGRKLSTFDVAHVKAITSYLLKIILRIKAIQKRAKEGAKIDYVKEIQDLKEDLTKEENELHDILEANDMTYQLEKIKELKNFYHSL